MNEVKTTLDSTEFGDTIATGLDAMTQDVEATITTMRQFPNENPITITVFYDQDFNVLTGLSINQVGGPDGDYFFHVTDPEAVYKKYNPDWKSAEPSEDAARGGITIGGHRGGGAAGGELGPPPEDYPAPPPPPGA